MEPGSDTAIALWEDADRVVSSLVLYPEARAALARAAREGRLGGARRPRSRRLVDRLWRNVDRIDLTERLAREAGDLAERHALRAYDAVHLASLASLHDRETVLVSADGALVEAARARGLPTLSP